MASLNKNICVKTHQLIEDLKALRSNWEVYQAFSFCYGEDTGSTNAYIVELNPKITEYTTGFWINFKANTTNTSSATININNLGAKSLRKLYNQHLTPRDIVKGQIVSAIYDGGNFQLFNYYNKPKTYCFVYLSSPQLIEKYEPVTIKYDTIVHDAAGAFDIATSKYIVPYDGKYLVTGGGKYIAYPVARPAFLIYINGFRRATAQYPSTENSEKFPAFSISKIFDLSAKDEIEIKSFHNSEDCYLANDKNSTFLTIARLT